MTRPFQKIFVIYPRGLRTGGPEALHQLVSTLRGLGQEAYLTPAKGTEGRERVAAYAHYDAPEAAQVEDRRGNAVVVPEYAMYELSRFEAATPYCWWLSIDNSPMFRYERRATDRWEVRRRGWALVREWRDGLIYRTYNSLKRSSVLNPRVRHLAQSHYAFSFLYARLNIVSAMVSDFTPREALEPARKLPSTDRGRTIAYNPQKAAAITDRLRLHFPEAEYVPLTGMSPVQVAEALGRSAVYLDLGHHPGKDRMPREAAVCGAVTLVARRGAGAFWEDVPIPQDHKITPDHHVLESATSAIQRVFAEPDLQLARQAHYRETILSEPQTFREEVSEAFIDGWIMSRHD